MKPKQSTGSSSSNEPKINLHQIELPKGGGAIGGIGENFHSDEFTGTFSIATPIPSSECRGVSPNLSLSYHSGSGNGPFGLGFGVNIPQITKKTSKGVPKYDGTDTFLWGGEDLVPLDGQKSQLGEYKIKRFHTRTLSEHDIIEYYFSDSGDSFWKIIDEHHVIHIFGKTKQAQIFDHENPSHIYTWLCEEVIYPQGDHIVYTYKHDEGSNNKYINIVYYGNDKPLKDNVTDNNDLVGAKDFNWHFQVVFDYGQYNITDLTRKDLCSPMGDWDQRKDPFTVYKSGFPIRTNRLCKNILVFHRFDDEFKVDHPILVHSINLEYDESSTITKLKAVSDTGYQFIPDGINEYSQHVYYLSKILPKTEYDYSKFDESKCTPRVLKDSEDQDLDITNYSFFDLYGEGVPGLLYSQDSTILYRSPILQKDSEEDNTYVIGYEDAKILDKVPVQARVSGNNAQHHLMDVTGNGFIDWLVTTPFMSGYYELSKSLRDSKNTWQSFNTFEKFPSEFSQSFARLLDITGDGLYDCVINCGNKIRFYQSKGKLGFMSPNEVDLSEDIPAAASAEDIYIDFLDILGTGTKHLVRVSNGELKYWPNLSHGKFGAPITMKIPEINKFNVKHLHFADIDGSGTPDLVYLNQDKLTVYFNESGNSFQEGFDIHLPEGFLYDDLIKVESADINGNGTSCLILKNEITRKSIYYDFCNGIKPHMMMKINNNIGSVTKLHYLSSTYYYLRNKNLWHTQLPFPVQVISKIEHIDEVSNTNLVGEYDYYHGYYDGEQREFRGFGRVDRRDCEISTGQDDETYTDPLLSKTWYHTGCDSINTNAQEELSELYKAEYFSSNKHRYNSLSNILDPNIPSKADSQQAFMALAGRTLRTEIYGLNNLDIPYSVHETNYDVSLIQPKNDNLYSIYYVYEKESIEYDYEQQLDIDPKIQHKINLRIDNFGNILESCEIHYKRLDNHEIPGQAKSRMTYDIHSYVNIENIDAYQIGVPYETKGYEIIISDDHDIKKEGSYFSIEDANNIIQHGLKSIPQGLESSPTCKLLNWEKFIYKDENNTLLPLKNVSVPLLLAQHQVAMYSDKQVSDIYLETGIDRKYLVELLEREGYFKLLDENGSELNAIDTEPSDSNYWWNNGLTATFNRAEKFFSLSKVTDAQGHSTSHEYDKYNIVAFSSTDAVGNSITAQNIDYQFLLPLSIIDINDNVSEVKLDPLGHVIYTSHYGTESGKAVGFNKLCDVTLRKHPNIEEIIDHPEYYIQGASSYYYYDYFAWQECKQPIYHMQIVAAEYPDSHRNQEFQLHVEYIDGFKRSLQSKMLVESGSSYIYDSKEIDPHHQGDTKIRWISTGRKQYNNKGQLVKEFEPYYINTHKYISNECLAPVGYSHTNFYDPMGRVYKVKTSKGFLVKHKWTPWSETSFDENNTIAESTYYQENIKKPDNDPVFEGLSKENIQEASECFNVNTTIIHDVLGHPVVKITTKKSKYSGKSETLATYLEHDILDRVVSSSDPRLSLENINNFENSYGLAHSGTLKTVNVDSGTHWLLNDYVGKPIFSYNQKGISTVHHYDAIHRPVSITIVNKGKYSVIECYEYGDTSKNIVNPKDHNLCGKLYRHYHQSGIRTTDSYDIMGHSLRTSQQLIKDHKITKPNWQNIQGDLTEQQPHSNPNDHELEDIIYQDEFTYNALGWALSKRNYFQNKIYNEYYISGRLNGVWIQQYKQDPVRYIKNITYNAKNQRQEIEYGNEMITKYHYDEANWHLLEQTTSIKDNTLYALRYKYDAVGNVIERYSSASDGIEIINSYVFDTLYQLVSATGQEKLEGNENITNYTEFFAYDNGGNLTEIDHNGKKTNIIIDKFSNKGVKSDNIKDEHKPIADYIADYFDPNGNLLQLNNINLTWNDYDHLQQIHNADKNIDEYYNYEHLVHRTRKVSVKEEQLVEYSVYLGDYEIRTDYQKKQKVRTIQLQGGSGNILSVTTSLNYENNSVLEKQPTIRYHLKDILNSCNVEIDENGAIVNHEEFTPYGETSFSLSLTPESKEYHDEKSPEQELNKRKYYRYGDKERDENTGLYYYGARYYIPSIGRWLNPDPAGYVDGLNLYAFVNGNPVTHIDIGGMGRKRKTKTTWKPRTYLKKRIPTERNRLFLGGGDLSYELAFIMKRKESVRKKIASKMIVTTYDDHETMNKKYEKTANNNKNELKKLGVEVLHRIDATQLHTHFPESKFKHIHFCHPHNGLITGTSKMIGKFFGEANKVLKNDGTIIIPHSKNMSHYGFIKGRFLKKHRNKFICKRINKFIDEQIRDRYPGYTHRKTKNNDSAESVIEGGSVESVFIRRTSEDKDEPFYNEDMKALPVSEPVTDNED